MKRINIYISEDTDRQIDALADLLQLNRSEVIRQSIESYSETYEAEIQNFIEGLDFSDDIDQELKDDISKCFDSPENFINSGVCINTLDRGIQKLKLYDFQQKLLFKLDSYNKLIINHSRQVGNSTILSAYALYYAMTHNNAHIHIASYCLQSSIQLLDVIDTMHTSLPIPIKNLIRCVAKSKREIKLSNGTIIHAITSTSPDSLKNHKSDMIILDEFSHTPISSVYELMTVVNKLVDTNPNMKLIIASVPNGINYFYKLWADAISNFNDYHAIKIPYTVIPHRDETWKQLEIAMLGKEKFEQEYECVFHEGTKGDLYA